jgi:hypothetical protein
MPIDKAAALAEIDAVFQRRKELEHSWFPEAVQEVLTLACAAIDRLAPPGSAYREQKEKAFKGPFLSVARSREEEIEARLQGVLRALRADYEAGRLRTFQQMVHADLFADFLEMADHLLEQGYKDAAAVTAGAVLEEHLRKLCGLHSVATAVPDAAGMERPKKLDTMNTDLVKASAYDNIERQSVQAWAAVRNAAAHGEYTKYDAGQVRGMIDGIRGFIARHRA